MALFTCDCCGRTIDGDRWPVSVYDDCGHLTIQHMLCAECKNEHTVICLGCWHRFYTRDTVLHPNGINSLCRNCKKNVPINDHVLGYEEEHSVLLPTHGRGNRLVGFEIEYMCHHCPEEDEPDDEGDCDHCKHLPTSIFNQLDERHLLDYAKSTLDSTVTGEVVTAPFPLQYLFSKAGKDALNTITDIVSICGGYATPMPDSPCKSCGGHVHVSRAFVDPCRQEAVADALAHFVYLTRAFWHKMSRRDEPSPYAIYSAQHRHGTAINFTNKTYEFRFWNATLTPDVMRARAVICVRLVEFLGGMKKDVLTKFLHISDKVFMYTQVLRPFINFMMCKQHSDEAMDLIRGVFNNSPLMEEGGSSPWGKINAVEAAFDKFIREVVLCPTC